MNCYEMEYRKHLDVIQLFRITNTALLRLYKQVNLECYSIKRITLVITSTDQFIDE